MYLSTATLKVSHFLTKTGHDPCPSFIHVITGLVEVEVFNLKITSLAGVYSCTSLKHKCLS